MKENEPLQMESESEEQFLSRWSRRKQAASQPLEERDIASGTPSEETEPVQLTDADMPPLESLDENADYSGFLSPKVTDELRQLALHKLFHSACFNLCDGLDDYADDFTNFEKLGDVMTADLRFRLQQEAKRAAEKLPSESETLDAETDTPEETLQLPEEDAHAESTMTSQTAQQTANSNPDSEEINA
jgi:hypothetical protein